MRFLRPLFIAAYAAILVGSVYADDMTEMKVEEVLANFNMSPEQFHLLTRQQTDKGEVSLYYSPDAEM